MKKFRRNVGLKVMCFLAGSVWSASVSGFEGRQYIGHQTTIIVDGNGTRCPAKFARIASLAGYPFNLPDANSLSARPLRNSDRCYRHSITGLEWNDGYALYQDNKLFAVSYYSGDKESTDSPAVDELMAYGAQFCTRQDYRCYVFADKEVWAFRWENPRLNAYKLRGTDEYEVRKAREKKENTIKNQKAQAAYEQKVARFRKNIKPGDDASVGLVIEVKGDLVKIQTNDRQCSQRDYEKNCINWIDTPVEKWMKRSGLYPK